MCGVHHAAWSDTQSHSEKAASFLSDLKVDAGLFSDPSRSEEWLMTVENLHHALLALEQQYVSTSPDVTPFWFSSTPLGSEYSEFLQLASKAPRLLARLNSTQKLAFFSNVVGMVTAACEDVVGTAS